MIAMMLDLKGDTDQLRKAYRASNDELQKQGHFEGLVFHTAGPTATGFRIVDVWRSRELFEKFAQRMIPIAQKNGMGGDARPEIWDVESTMNVPSS
jgi:hypothetical protein